MEEPKYYSIEKFNESNYCSWSQVIESDLDDQDLWEVVQGNETKPAQSTEQLALSAMEEHEIKLEEWAKK